MASSKIVDALQPQKPMQPMQAPMSPPVYSNGAGMAGGRGYAPFQGQFGNGYSGMGQQVAYGSGLPARGQGWGSQGMQQPMGMSPMMYGGNGGWGSGLGMGMGMQPRSVGPASGYGSDSDAHGFSGGMGGGGLW